MAFAFANGSKTPNICGILWTRITYTRSVRVLMYALEIGLLRSSSFLITHSVPGGCVSAFLKCADSRLPKLSTQASLWYSLLVRCLQSISRLTYRLVNIVNILSRPEARRTTLVSVVLGYVMKCFKPRDMMARGRWRWHERNSRHWDITYSYPAFATCRTSHRCSVS